LLLWICGAAAAFCHLALCSSAFAVPLRLPEVVILR
jgi:hypothetical protein